MDEDYSRSDEQKRTDAVAELLLMIKTGLFDHAIRTSQGRPVFAARPAVERVTAAWLGELAVLG